MGAFADAFAAPRSWPTFPLHWSSGLWRRNWMGGGILGLVASCYWRAAASVCDTASEFGILVFLPPRCSLWSILTCKYSPTFCTVSIPLMVLGDVHCNFRSKFISISWRRVRLWHFLLGGAERNIFISMHIRKLWGPFLDRGVTVVTKTQRNVKT